MSVITYVGYYCNQESVGKNALLEWIQSKIPSYNITNFTSNWKDGMALGCLTDVVSGGQFPDYEEMTPDDPLGNAEKSMDHAERLGVPKIITPEQFVDPTLDPLTMMTYLTYFQHVTPSTDSNILAGITAAGPGIKGDKAFKETNFVIRGRIPDWAPLDVNITAPDGSKVDYQKNDPVANSTAVRYTPQKPGTYTVEILVNKEHIRGSPFTLHHIEPSNSAGCFASGQGIEKCIVGEKAEFTVNCVNGGAGQLQLEIRGPTGNIGTEISETNDRIYAVKYTPVEAGPHTIAALWASNHVNNSPFTARVIDPKRCVASGSGLTGATIDQPATFRVKTQNAGQSTLSVNINGPNGAVPVQIHEDAIDEYICSYTPTDKGDHTIEVNWENIPITGSPFHVSPVVPADASKCQARDLPIGYLRASKEASFIVDTHGAGDGELKTSGRGPSLPQKVMLHSIDSNSYGLSFSPFEVGVLCIDVLFADKPIHDSPFKFLVNDPTKCHVNAAAIKEGSYTINQPVSFRVSAQFAGEGEVTAKLHGPKGQKNVDIKDQGDGTYLIHFVPEEAGSHAIDIYFDGEEIPNAPVQLFVGAGSGADDVIVSEPVPGRLGVFVVDTPHKYVINAAGANEGDLLATCIGVYTGHKPGVEIEDHGDRHYTVAVNTATPDEYKVNILWGGDPVPGSSFIINIVDKPRPENVIIKGPVYEVGQLPVSLTADVNDAGAGELSASCHGRRIGNVPVKISEKEPKLYDLNLEAPQPDLLTISVFWSDEHVPGSPFKVNIIPPDASKIIVTKPDSFATSVRAIFRVDATEAGVGHLKSYCRAENSANLPVELDKPDPDVEKYRCIITPIREDIYHLSLLWSDKDVPGSPFKIDLVPKIHADRVIVDDPVYSMAEQPVDTMVDCSHAGPGKLDATCTGESTGPVPVSITEVDQAKYKLTFIPSNEDNYKLSISFEGQSVPRSPLTIPVHPIQEVADMVLLSNVEAGLEFPSDWEDVIPQESTPTEMYMLLGNPLDIDFEDPAPENIPEAEPKVDDREEKELKATAVGDKNGPAHISVTKKSKGDYGIYFNPTKPDRYVLSLEYDDKPAPNSPIIVHYSIPVDASKCVIFGLEQLSFYPIIDKPLNFGVDATAAGKGSLNVTTSGPSGDNPSNVQVTEDEKQPGIYHISYTPTGPGEHRVNLHWGSDLIPGCPLVFNVVSGSAITGKKVYPYNNPVHLKLTADCKPKELEAYAILDGTNQRTKVKIAKDGKGQFRLTFQPSQPGFYDVHVHLRGTDVAGSPYRLRYANPPDPNKVKVDIDPADVAFVHEPIKFSINTVDAGEAELVLKANIRKKGKDKPDFKIMDNGDSTYTGEYIPITTGIHTFDALFDNKPIPGSPFKIDVIEKPPEISHTLASNLNLLEVSKSVNVYFKLTPGSSISTITASATGRNIYNADFKLQRLNEEGLYRAHFAPSFPDDYQLEVLHKGDPIAGSPFPVKVVGLGGFEPSKSPSQIENPAIVDAKRPFTLLLPTDLDEVSPDDLKVEVDGPSDAESVKPSVGGDNYGAFSVSFTPDVPGDYLIHVSKDENPLPGSPYRVTVKEYKSDPSKCFVVLEDKPLFEKAQRFGKPCQFRISTLDAGPGTLNITARGPGKADVKIFDNNDGTYTCEFSPSVPGQYHVDILWDDQAIDESPYTLTFKQRKKKIITGLDLDLDNFRVGVPHRFKLHCSEIGDGELEVNIKPLSAAHIKVSNLGSDTYQVEILPEEQGNHELSVLFGGNHIMDSPFNVTFNERGDASKCYMISNDVEQSDEGEDHVVFLISTENAGKGKLTAHVDNPNSDERQSVVIDELEEHKFKVHFDLGEGSEYQLIIKYDGNHIDGSPFKLLFADQTDAAVCRAEGEGLTFSQVDKEGKFSVFTEGAGDGELMVKIASDDGTEIVAHTSDLGHGEHEVTYIPTRSGDYKISIKWSNEEIPESPFNMKCYVPLHATNLKVVDPPTEAYLETPITFKVVTIEDMNEEGDIAVSAKSRQSSITGMVEKEYDGSYTCTLEPTTPGKYLVKVTLNGDNINESPFKIKVSEPPKPYNVKAYGPGLEDGYIGQEGNFTVETANAGTGTLSVRVHGPKGAFRINMRRHPDDDRIILVRYDPKYAGNYSIDITWSEEHIPGSPFKVEIHKQTDDIVEKEEEAADLTNGIHDKEKPEGESSSEILIS